MRVRLLVRCLCVLACAAAALLQLGPARRAGAQAPTKTYIVQLAGEPVVVAKFKAEQAGRPFDAAAYRAQVVAEQERFLERVRAAGVPHTVAGVNAPNGDVTADIRFRFNYVYNGVTLVAPESAASQLARIEGVAAVHEDRPLYPGLDRALDYVRATQLYGNPPKFTQFDQLSGGGLHGEGMIVAVVDTGVDWTHPMFGGDPTPPRFGVAPQAAAVATNPKVIYYLNLTAGAVVDDFGHGTHVAGDMAGYTGRAPGPDGLPGTADDVTIHGVAPQARIMAYKTLSTAGIGLQASSIMAVEDAVQPFTLTGHPKPVPHVINLSLGNESNNPDDPSSVACDNATLAGVTIVASAGNAGRSTPTNPTGEATLGSPGTGRRVITVAANEDPGSGGSQWSVDVLNASAVEPNRTGAVIPARNLAANPGFQRLQLYPMSGTAQPHQDSVAQRYVLVTTPQTPAGFLGAAGRIALVKNTSGASSGAFAQTVNNAAAAGAVGCILISTTTNPGGIYGNIPGAVILPADGEVLVDAMRSNDDNSVDPPAGTVSELPVRINPYLKDALQMADFSSKGPVGGWGQVKPDVTAPGVNILSATVRAGGVRVAAAAGVPPGVGYSYMMNPTGYVPASGTSFSSPITAGVAALVKQAHPAWTPAMIRAALVNTATNLRNPDGTAQPDGTQSINDQGGGLIDAEAAVNAKALMGAGAPGPTGDAPPARPNRLGLAGPLIGLSPGNPDFSATYSFGSVPIASVVGGATHTQTVNIYDFADGGGAGTYQLSASNVRNVDGTNFRVELTNAAGEPVESIEVPAGGAASFNVRVVVPDGEKISDGTQYQWYVYATRADGGQNLRMPFYYRSARPVVSAAAPTIGNIEGAELAYNPPLDTDGGYRLNFSKPATGAQAARLRIEESSDGGATWSRVGEVPASQTTFDLAGKGNGSYQYRVVGLFPVQYGLIAGPASATRAVAVERRSEADVTSLVEGALAAGSYLFDGTTTKLGWTLRNKTPGTVIYPRVTLFVVSVSSGSGAVRVTNAENGGDGVATPAEFGYSNQVGTDFAPGEKSQPRELRFSNPSGELFSFTAVVKGHFPDAGAGAAGAASESGGSEAAQSGSGDPAGAPQGGAMTFTVNPLTGTVTLVR